MALGAHVYLQEEVQPTLSPEQAEISIRSEHQTYRFVLRHSAVLDSRRWLGRPMLRVDDTQYPSPVRGGAQTRSARVSVRLFGQLLPPPQLRGSNPPRISVGPR